MILREDELLMIYEQGLSAGSGERASGLLALARGLSAEPGDAPGEAGDALRCGLHDGEAHILALRERLFGPGLAAVASCPACLSPLELDLDTRALRGEDPHPWDNPPREVQADDLRALWRQPDLRDLRAAGTMADPRAAREFLVRCCVADISRAGVPVGWDALDAQEREKLEQALEVEAEKAELRVRVICPHCGEAGDHGLDAGLFLWSELARRARGVLLEVHDLARYYGWSEAEILSLSPARRRIYLEMAAA